MAKGEAHGLSVVWARRLQVNLRLLLSSSNLTARQLFECLCERDRARLWPWLGDAQTEVLQKYLQSKPPVLEARQLLDSVLTRVSTLRRCASRHAPSCRAHVRQMRLDCKIVLTRGTSARVVLVGACSLVSTLTYGARLRPGCKHCVVDCRGGSSDDALRVLTPADVIHRVLEPLRQRRACSAAYLQAVASQFGMAAKAHIVRLPVASDIFLLNCVLDQVRNVRILSMLQRAVRISGRCRAT